MHVCSWAFSFAELYKRALCSDQHLQPQHCNADSDHYFGSTDTIPKSSNQQTRRWNNKVRFLEDIFVMSCWMLARETYTRSKDEDFCKFMMLSWLVQHSLAVMLASIRSFVWKQRMAGRKSTCSGLTRIDGIKRIFSLQISSTQRTFVISNINKSKSNLSEADRKECSVRVKEKSLT